MVFTNINYGEGRKLNHLYYDISIERDWRKNPEGKRFYFGVWYWRKESDAYDLGVAPVWGKDFIGIRVTFAWLIRFKIYG